MTILGTCPRMKAVAKESHFEAADFSFSDRLLGRVNPPLIQHLKKIPFME